MKSYRFFSALLAVTLLSACGGSATKAVNQPVITNETEAVVLDDTETQSDIEKIISRFEASQDRTETIWSLLDYAQLQQSVGQCDTAELIIWHLIDDISLGGQRVAAELLRSECVILSLFQGSGIDEEDVLRLETWLANAKDLNASSNLPNQRLKIATAALAIIAQPVESSFIEILSVEPSDSALYEVKNELIWRSMTAKSGQQRTELAQRDPIIASYLAMYDIISDANLDDRTRQQQLNTWITANADEQLIERIPSEVHTFLQTPLNNSNKIAALLPLSGRLSAQGEAIKHGIISAYFSNANTANNEPESLPLIEFIDTGSNAVIKDDVQTINFLEYSHVIGPLLPTHISALEAIITPGTNTLYLNTSKLDDVDLGTSYFSLSPEQEATQIAQSMMRSKIANPVLIYAPGNRAKRMRDTFLRVWEQGNGRMPADVSFSDNKSMRVGITNALGVLQSEQRIKQMSNLTTERVHSVTRNRRDVDAFVVFASAQQAELINPIIESSISLFGNVDLPVYASSFSYSHKQNRNSLRDLRNMVFLDMPFVQPSGRNSELARQVDDVFKQPSTSFLRLFAFGHDAYTLVKNNVQMNIFSHINRDGLTGTLTMKQNEIQRDLDLLAINTPIARNSN
ncbi:MAG: penicillin-binding protein activator [Pseudomonadota bacterium]